MGLAGFARGVQNYRFFPIPATDLARKHVGRAVPNVPLLAAFAAVTGVIGLESLVRAINEKFPGPVAARNVAAANEAYAIAVQAKETAHA
jgi:pyruvate ferredoxin oxidoreductase gamma subunit